MPELKLTKNLVEELAKDIKSCFIKGKDITTYNDICKLIEKLEGKIELTDEVCSPYFIKNEQDTFTIFIAKEHYKKINDPYYESKLIYDICQILSSIFLVTGYAITKEYWLDIPTNVKLDGIVESINGRFITAQMSNYFACNLYIGKDRFMKELYLNTENEYANISKMAESLNVSKTIVHTFGYLLDIFPNIMSY